MLFIEEAESKRIEQLYGNPYVEKMTMSSDQSKKPAVLLAEDDPDQSDSLRESLENAGYSVDAVFSGDMALRRLTERQYAVAIMDLRMPGLNGGTVLKVCRFKSPPSTTPIIMLSAFATDHDSRQFINDGAAAFYSKPCDLDTLIAKVNELTKKPSTP